MCSHLSPPLNFAPHWLGNNVAYMMAKYAMTLCAIGIAEVQREHGVASNALWPRTTIADGGREQPARRRGDDGHLAQPEIMADAAYAILTRPSREYTANTAIDDEVLAEEGVTDLEQYSVTPGTTQYRRICFRRVAALRGRLLRGRARPGGARALSGRAQPAARRVRRRPPGPAALGVWLDLRWVPQELFGACPEVFDLVGAGEQQLVGRA